MNQARSTPPSLHRGSLRAAVVVTSCAFALVACNSSASPTITAEGPELAPWCAGGNDPKQYGTVTTQDGPFNERTPAYGVPQSVRLNPVARVAPAELFKTYAKEFCLGPKDEVRFERVVKAQGGVDVWDCAYYRQFHDGYAVESGELSVDVHMTYGFANHVMWSVVVGLPDAPKVTLTEERGKQIAIAEVVKEKGKDASAWHVQTASFLWATPKGSFDSYLVQNYRVVFRAHVVGAYIGDEWGVDLDAATGARVRFGHPTDPNVIRD